MTLSVRFLLLAALAFAGSAAWAQGGRPAKTLPSFRSDTELVRFLREIAAERNRQIEMVTPCDNNLRTARHERATPGSAVIDGRVTNTSGEPLGGVTMELSPIAGSTKSAKNGRYRLRVPAESLLSSRSLVFKVRHVGYGRFERSIKLGPRDSLELDFSLCPAPRALVAVTASAGLTIDGGAQWQMRGALVTNTQTAGVDEGGIVKLHGNHLVILRRGRLFTVAIGGDELKPITAVDAFGPGLDPRAAWYDELLVTGDRVVVVGYSYNRGGTEFGIFDIDAAGGLKHRGTYQLRSNDYYSSRNYASRLIGNRLIFYTPLYLRWGLEDPLSALPSMRHWNPSAGRDSGGRFERIVTAERIYRPAGWSAAQDLALHTVTVCDLASRELTCEGTIVIGPAGRVFYVAAEAVYVWMSDWGHYGRRRTGAAILCRMPLDGSAPSALGVTGTPVDQFSFFEGADGHVNVLVRADALGDAMWAPEWAGGNASLLRVPLNAFGDGSTPAPSRMYRPIPTETGGGEFHNRFVGDYLLYGNGSGWGRPKAEGSVLYVVPWKGGPLTRVMLPHGTDRIEVMGPAAVVVGADERDLHFTGIRFDGTPRVAQRYTMREASQGELRSHGFFYRPDAAHEGVLGLPVREGGRPGYQHLFDGSASIVFLQNQDWRFEPLGTLNAEAERARDDACKASCVDWYGNARPLFIRGRVFALLGYELVEGSIRAGRIAAVQRISFAPAAVRAVRH